MLKWYKEFKLKPINKFEKDWNQKLNQMENKLLNLVEACNVRSRSTVSNCKNHSIR